MGDVIEFGKSKPPKDASNSSPSPEPEDLEKMKKVKEFTEVLTASMSEVVKTNLELLNGLGLSVEDIAVISGAAIGKYLTETIINPKSSPKLLRNQIAICEMMHEAVAHGCQGYVLAYTSNFKG